MCENCVVTPRPRKHSYLIQLLDTETARWGRCVIQSECPHGMQEWVSYLATRNELYVHDEDGEKFLMLHPLVMDVDHQTAAHLPLKDPDPVN
jgi:hypothetical protein